MPDRDPLLSIIIPFAGDDRGSVSFLSSWTKQTGVRPESFELIVGFQASAEKLQEVQKILRPNDTLFELPESDDYVAGKEMPLYREGCLKAKGKFVLLTEDHVVASKGCLQTVIADLEKHPDSPGFVLNSGHINRNRFAKAEGNIYDQSLRAWYDPKSWDRIRQRGTVIRKDLLESVGGIPDRFGLFGELVLSLRLWKGGNLINLHPSAEIRHVNLCSLDHFSEEIRNFLAGEILYLEESTVEDTGFFGMRQAVSEGLLYHREHFDTLASCSRTAYETAPGKFSEYGSDQLRIFAGKIQRMGPIAEMLQRFSFYASTRWKCALISLGIRGPAKSSELMLSMWNATAAFHARDILQQAKSPFNPVTVDSPSSIAKLPATSMFGFHALESVQGSPEFRWSGLASGIYLDLDAEPHSVILSFASVRGPASAVGSVVFFDGTLIGEKDLIRTETSLEVKVRPEVKGQHLLILFCDPLEAPGDIRSLGLPVSAIQVNREEPS